MRNRNLWILLSAALLIAAVFAAAVFIKPSPNTLSQEQLRPTVTASGSAVKGYLLVTVGGNTYQPIALDGEGEFTITQGDTGKVNVVHITPDSVWMAASTCDNQDCVEQGVVSLDTMNDRVLANMIICLPHQVALELYTADEMAALLASWEGTT